MDFKPGKLYKMLEPVVAERPHRDRNGEWWCDMHGLDPGDIIMYVGFFVPESQTTQPPRPMHHVLKGDMLLTTHLTDSGGPFGRRPEDKLELWTPP